MEKTVEELSKRTTYGTMPMNIVIIKNDNDTYTGYLKAIPGVVSEAKTIEELKVNLNKGFKSMVEWFEMRNRKLSMIERITDDKELKLILTEDDDSSSKQV